MTTDYKNDNSPGKTILVLTDFSISADHAAYYSLKIAEKIKADILLCHVIPPPHAVVKTGLSIAAREEKDCLNDLDELSCRLNDHLDSEGPWLHYRPTINYCCKAGLIAPAVNEVAHDYQVVMAVISMHWTGGLNTILWRSNAREIIEKAECPVLVIPYQARFIGFKKIAFATDLASTNVNAVRCLSGLAQYFDSSILITHVAPEKPSSQIDNHIINHFYNEVTANVDYAKIFYREIKSRSVINGLDWLSEHTDVNLIVLIHHHRNFFQKIFEGSVTQKIAGRLDIPMMVFPYSKVKDKLPVF
ncbi:MAG: universal stress protein [Mucilaginibacter sp.]